MRNLSEMLNAGRLTDLQVASRFSNQIYQLAMAQSAISGAFSPEDVLARYQPLYAAMVLNTPGMRPALEALGNLVTPDELAATTRELNQRLLPSRPIQPEDRIAQVTEQLAVLSGQPGIKIADSIGVLNLHLGVTAGQALSSLAGAYTAFSIDPQELAQTVMMSGASLMIANGQSPQTTLASTIGAMVIGRLAGVAPRAIGSTFRRLTDLFYAPSGTDRYMLNMLLPGNENLPSPAELRRSASDAQVVAQHLSLQASAERLGLAVPAGSPYAEGPFVAAQRAQWASEQLGLVISGRELARSQEALNRERALFGLERAYLQAQYGPNLGPVDRNAYYAYERAVLEARRTSQPLPGPQDFPSVGLIAREFYGSIEHQRRMLVYGQSPLLAGEAYEEQMAELERQSRLFEERQKYEADIRRQQVENQSKSLDAQQAALDDQREALRAQSAAVQAQIAAAQRELELARQQFGAQLEVFRREVAVYELLNRPVTPKEAQQFIAETGLDVPRVIQYLAHRDQGFVTTFLREAGFGGESEEAMRAMILAQQQYEQGRLNTPELQKLLKQHTGNLLVDLGLTANQMTAEDISRLYQNLPPEIKRELLNQQARSISQAQRGTGEAQAAPVEAKIEQGKQATGTNQLVGGAKGILGPIGELAEAPIAFGLNIKQLGVILGSALAGALARGGVAGAAGLVTGEALSGPVGWALLGLTVLGMLGLTTYGVSKYQEQQRQQQIFTDQKQEAERIARRWLAGSGVPSVPNLPQLSVAHPDYLAPDYGPVATSGVEAPKAAATKQGSGQLYGYSSEMDRQLQQWMEQLGDLSQLSGENAPQVSFSFPVALTDQEGKVAGSMQVNVAPPVAPSKQITINFGGVTINGNADPDQAGRWQEELLQVILQALQSETDPAGAPASP